LQGVSSDQVLQILGNLLNNAVEATAPDGSVLLRVSELARDGRRLVRFAVSDSGPGVDPDIIGRLFEPLVTTKATGIGLGLALSRKLADQQGGELSLIEGELAGAGFALDVPVFEGSGSAAPSGDGP